MAGADDWEPIDGSVEPAEQYVVDRLELIDDLTHDVRGALLRRLRDPASVAELADERGVPVTRLYHHVNRLADLGLIRVVATRRSGAVVERRYQAAARTFTIGDELLAETEPATLAKVLGSLFDVARLSFQREVERGLFDQAEFDEVGVLGLHELRLSDDRRAQLIAALTAVLEDYRDESDGDTFTLFVSGFPSTA